ncbi:hypothetical protein SUGI_0751550 [Cryptomeria japonica]|uniref:uncharacterized protein LOC131073091 n=1 Tax=Cryptomeria japonica TaxID=3369 RepID=UPI0024146959|nr:uncharacterized protein LOC131073091 [Cryptomeria japonica]GLJ37083.1 hypothetical protein SUGI_0751550 [Cryptomeria japonica]
MPLAEWVEITEEGEEIDNYNNNGGEKHRNISASSPFPSPSPLPLLRAIPAIQRMRKQHCPLLSTTTRRRKLLPIQETSKHAYRLCVAAGCSMSAAVISLIYLSTSEHSQSSYEIL